MYACQNSLIKHLELEFSAAFKTIKEYAGDFAIDDDDDIAVDKLLALRPALFVLYRDSTPSAQEAFHQVDLYFLTETLTFQKEANKKSNLQLAEPVLEYLRTRPVFNNQGGGGTYYIDKEKTQFRSLAVNPRFTVTKAELFIDDNTKEAA